MTATQFRPLLAAAAQAGCDLRFPLLGSPKIDGIRCVELPDLGPSTRRLKPVPNAHVHRLLSHPSLVGLDGEIVVGPPTASDVFNRTSRAVMSHGGEPDFTFFVFDDVSDPTAPFQDRHGRVRARAREGLPPYVTVVPHRMLSSASELSAYEESVVAEGYEGVMLRAPDGRYKFGRSTLKEGILLKLKRFEDLEATVVGYAELQHNLNEAKPSALGLTERGSSQENLTPGGTLGALECRAEGFIETFRVGTGFDAATRDLLWQERDTLIGRTVKVKFQAVGTVDRPRLPVFVGFRDATDM